MLKTSGKRGVPQGGVLSPLLANIYLTEVDAMQGRVETMEILVVADRDARGLHQDQPKEQVTLLRDVIRTRSQTAPIMMAVTWLPNHTVTA